MQITRWTFVVMSRVYEARSVSGDICAALAPVNGGGVHRGPCRAVTEQFDPRDEAGVMPIGSVEMALRFRAV